MKTMTVPTTQPVSMVGHIALISSPRVWVRSEGVVGFVSFDLKDFPPDERPILRSGLPVRFGPGYGQVRLETE